jgi:hypothetical protein
MLLNSVYNLPTIIKHPQQETSSKKASMTALHRRAVLNRQQARDIFLLKHYHSFGNSHAASTVLAKTYRISSKAIRDIWCGRSWLDATFDMWDGDDRPVRKTLGRPKGRKDTKPRKFKGPSSKCINQFEVEEKFVPQEACQNSEQLTKPTNKVFHSSSFLKGPPLHVDRSNVVSSTVHTNRFHQQQMQLCADELSIYGAPPPPMQLPSIELVKAHCLASMKYAPLSTWEDSARSQSQYYTAQATASVPAMSLMPRAMFCGSWPSYAAHNPVPCYDASIFFNAMV